MLRSREKRVVPLEVRVLIAGFPQKPRRGAVTKFCAEHDISRSWFYELRSRMADDPQVSAILPRSRAPKNSPHQISEPVADLACEIRKKLAGDGWDNGPLSVRAEMAGHNVPVPSRATLARLFTARGMVTPAPRKRPRSSYRSYAYELPNMMWCSDGFDYLLAGGAKAVVLQLLDDCSRYDLGSYAASGETSREIRAMLDTAIAAHGVPQRMLTDNASAFNPSRRGHIGQVEAWLRSLGVDTKTCRPRYPQGNGKAERSHQTMKRWLAARPPAATLEDLQALIEQYRAGYNQRPHQALAMATPAHVWNHLPHAEPPTPAAITAQLIDKRIKVAANGNVATGRTGTINIGTTHAGHHVIVLIEQTTISILDDLGTFIRTVTIEPGRTYYGLKPRP